MTFEPIVLYHGYDKLEVAYQGALSRSALSALETAKARAKSEGGDVMATIGTLKCVVKGYGTNSTQGYAYIFDTGREGIMWVAKRSTDPQQWNLRASVSSGLLLEQGFKGARKILDDHLEAFGSTVLAESVGRVDYCVDIQMDADGTKSKDAFKLDPHAFIAHSKTSREIIEAAPDERTPSEPDKEPFYRIFGDKYVQTVTLGRMPGRQLQVYNKRAESVKFKRTHWFAAWGKDPKKCPNVWRVEMRAGKEYLRDWNLKTLDDIEAAMGDICKDCLTKIRYVKGVDDITNVSRAENHILWVLAASTVMDAMKDSVSGLVRGRMVSIRRKDAEEIYSRQLEGLAAALSVVSEDMDDVEGELPDRVYAMLKHYVRYSPDRLKASIKKTRARLVIIPEPEPPQNQNHDDQECEVA